MRYSHLLTPLASGAGRLRTGALARALGLSCILALASSATAPAQSFTPVSTGITDAHHGASTWGDYDNDDDLDVLVTGEMSSYAPFADIYQNTSGVFSALGAGIGAVSGGNGVSGSAWGDFDNDGDLDVIVTGQVAPGVQTTLYRNNGGTFSAVTVSPSALLHVHSSAVAWGDYDNDGDLDLFIAGYNGIAYMTLYRNDGASGGGWNFTDVTPPSFTPTLGAGSAAWGDYDNDGDMDLAVNGFRSIMVDPQTVIYRNDGGSLVQSGINNLAKGGMGTVTWGDLNNDGWLDLVVTGNNASAFQGGPSQFRVYRNNQNGTFTQSAAFNGIGKSSVTLGDYNNDGKLDMVVSGIDASNIPFMLAYKGNGNATFTLDPNPGLPVFPTEGYYEGQVSFGDYDNDGRLDRISTGRRIANTPVYTRVYHNTTGATPNSLPTAPTVLNATASSTSIVFSWNQGSDAETPTAALNYNIVVTNQTTGTTVMAPMANTSNGYRKVVQLGNTNHNTYWVITGLTPGQDYSFCVQTIDHQFGASPFACGPTVTTTTAKADAMIGDCIGDVGTEPNNACGTNYWMSPNIYVRNNQDGLFPGNDVHQSPLSETTNWVYVKVKNLSPTETMQYGRVHLYFAKGSTGLGWPAQWTNNYISGVVYGDYIGQANVVGLAPGNTVIVEIPWDNVPDPSVYNDPDAHHFCLLARFVSGDDPMTFAEITPVYDNTQNNNNIAWKNLSIIDVDGPFAILGAGNIRDRETRATFRFVAPHNEDGSDDNILQHCQVSVDLGQELYMRWRDGGFQGVGVEPVEGSTLEVRMTSPQAEIRGIAMRPGEQFNMRIKIGYPDKFDEKVAGRIYTWDVIQFDSESDMPIGGETYSIRMPRNEKEGKRAVGMTLSAMLKLSASPNPTSAATTISYTLPEDSRVTLGLYDVTGRLVRTLVPATQQKAGGYTIEWDGTASTGETVPSGVYFYRIETADGTAQGQIRITR